VFIARQRIGVPVLAQMILQRVQPPLYERFRTGNQRIPLTHRQSSELFGGSAQVAVAPKAAFNTHISVRRKLQRLPSSLLIENASSRSFHLTQPCAPRRFRSSLATIRPSESQLSRIWLVCRTFTARALDAKCVTSGLPFSSTVRHVIRVGRRNARTRLLTVLTTSKRHTIRQVRPKPL
jgi:hypothetical protein